MKFRLGTIGVGALAVLTEISISTPCQLRHACANEHVTTKFLRRSARTVILAGRLARFCILSQPSARDQRDKVLWSVVCVLAEP